MSILKWFRRKPEALVIQDELGTFLLEHPQSDRFYEGTVPWPPEEEALVDLEIDGGEPPAADAALAHLCGIMAEAGEWDRRLRAYAADEMAGGDGWIETWEDEDSGGSRRTREEFIRRLSIGFIRVHRDGTLFFYYDLDGMFTDHGLGIHANISGEIFSYEICG